MNDRAGTHIWIRADGNMEIASGHLRRCLTVADALRARGCAVTFLVADKESAALLHQMADAESGFTGISVRVLHTRYDRPEGDTAALIPLFEKERPDFLLVDSYFMKAPDFLRLREMLPGVQLGYIDDLAVFDPPVDLLINYGARPPEAFYQTAAKKLFGPLYAPLRPQFADAGAQYRVRERAERMLLTTGGTDPYGMAARIVRRIGEDPAFADVCIEAVLPTVSGADSGGGFWAEAERGGRLRLHRNVSEMGSLMASCDLAVSAGGTTLYELCAVGVPAAAFSMADNQRDFAGRLAETGAIFYAGDVRGCARTEGASGEDGAPGEKTAEAAERVAERMTAWLARQMQDAAERRRLSGIMRGLTDGRGAARIAEKILALSERERGAA